MDREIEEKAALIRALLDQQPTNSNSSSITVNGGQWIAYLSLTLVAVTLAVVALACLFVAFQLSDLRRQDETFQAYIHAGYVQPETKEEKTE